MKKAIIFDPKATYLAEELNTELEGKVAFEVRYDFILDNLPTNKQYDFIIVSAMAVRNRPNFPREAKVFIGTANAKTVALGSIESVLTEVKEYVDLIISKFLPVEEMAKYFI
jgi:hypothetical protein